MNDETIRIFPLGDSALTVEFGHAISKAINKRAISFANHIEAASFPGFIESVPAYSSMTIFYDLLKVRQSFPKYATAFDAVKSIAEKALKASTEVCVSDARMVEIPVHFDANSSLDLDFVAEHNSLTPTEVVKIFTSQTYRVFMLGFLPGFTYMGEVDYRLATPRKETPRTLVSKGSVGIAGKQTGIYSLESPGGWQIIGRTDVEMFTPDTNPPSLLRPGDEVRFIGVK